MAGLAWLQQNYCHCYLWNRTNFTWKRQKQTQTPSIYNPLLYETVLQVGFFSRILSRNSSSKLSTSIEAFCENKAQQSGVAKVKHTPQNRTWIGELAHGKRFKIVVFFSRKFTKTGVSTIPVRRKRRKSLALTSTAVISILTRTRHENSAQRHLSDALLSCYGRVSIGHSIVVRHWYAVLKFSKIIQKGQRRVETKNGNFYTNCIRIKGMFIQLAAATAARGTNLGKSPVEFWACY